MQKLLFLNKKSTLFVYMVASIRWQLQKFIISIFIWIIFVMKKYLDPGRLGGNECKATCSPANCHHTRNFMEMLPSFIYYSPVLCRRYQFCELCITITLFYPLHYHMQVKLTTGYTATLIVDIERKLCCPSVHIER